MSSDKSTSIPVYHEHDQVPLRLLELPPELLASVTSKNPPQLTLKSTRASTIHNDRADAGNALLCTPDKTYEIKQVQSSNTLLLLRPVLNNGIDEESVTTLSAFSTCTGTLELLPHAPGPKTKSPREWLVSLLPIYDIDTDYASAVAYAKSALFDDIPFSNGELEAAWTSLVAFQTDEKCFRPSARILIELWKAMSASVGSLGTSMAGQLPCEWLMNDVEGFPKEMTQATLRRLRSVPSSPLGASCTLDESTTGTWLGEAVLEAAKPDERALPVLLDEWRSLVPDEWQHNVTKERLMDLDSYKALSQAVGSDQGPVLSSEVKPDSKRKSGPAARNWHEKFKRSKT